MRVDQDHRNEMLLDCLRPEPEGVDAARLKRISTADWDHIVQQSAMQKVAPLLYHRLRARGLDQAVPPDVLQGLEALYHLNAVQNVQLYHDLGQVLSWLRQDGIPAIVLKGAFLAEIVYGNIALRPMVDMDLMVPASQVSQVVERLSAAGYRPVRPYSLEAELAVDKGLPKFARPNAPAIEVHWTITRPTRPYCISMDGLWERACPVAFASVMALGLCPEDLLLHLGLHTTYQHSFLMGLRPPCDIAETVRHFRDDLDWDVVQRRASQWGWDGGVYLALRLARDLVGAAVPDGVLRSLQPDGFDEGILADAREQLFADRQVTGSPSPDFARMWGSQGLGDKARTLLRSLFPPARIMSAMYPPPPDSPRLYLYYGVRFKDLLVRYLGVLWRLVRGDEEVVSLIERRNALREWLELN